jgi:hypothetical protein
LALSLLSRSVTFNIFTKLHDYDLLNAAIKNIPANIHVRVWPKREIDPTKLCRPCEVFLLPEIELTWVQCTRYMLHLARVNGDEWIGHCHDDGTCSEEDFNVLLESRKTAPANTYKISAIAAEDPEKRCCDVYVLYNVQKYWDLGGHDANFFLYWTDIDFHTRQVKAGNIIHEVLTPSITHIGSASMKLCSDIEKTIHHINFLRDKNYFTIKHPNHVNLQ